MEKVVLKATRRDVIGKKVSTLRREGKLPAVIYGHHLEATPITLDLRETTKVLSNLTTSSLITIDIDGVENAALVRDRQRDYIRNVLIHLDFQAVSLTERIRANVRIDLSGISPAVKDFNGVIVTGINEIEVICLPQDLPERLVVDISTLAKIGDGLYVRDVSFGEKVEILEDKDDMIVIITAAIAEEVVEEVVEAVEEPEVIEKGKKEEEAEEE
jgi:large subunit ribosomal protein L25